MVGWLALVGTLRAADGPVPIEVPARTTPVDFQTEILPILHAHCSACHNPKKVEAGLVLDSPAAILKGGDSGPAIVAGKGADSLLLKVASHRQESFMPPADNTVGAKPLSLGQLGLIQLWIDQGATGSVSASRTPRWHPLPSGYQPIFATAVTGDGQYAVCSRGNRLFDYHVPTGQLAATLADPGLSDIAHRDVIRSLAFDDAGGLLASGGFREVKLWQRPRVTRRAEWPHEAPLETVAISQDARLAATGDENGRIRLWDVESGKTLHSFAAHQAAVTGLVFSSDGATLFSASLDKSLRAWKIADASPLGKPVELASPIRAVALVHPGDRLVSGSADGLVLVWSIEALVSAAGATGDDVKPLQEIKAHSGSVTTLAAVIGQAGEFLSGGEDGLVRRWDAQTGKQLRQLANDGPVVALAASADGRRIATAGANLVKFFDDGGKLIAQLQGDPRAAAAIARTDAEIAFSKSAIALGKQDIKSYEGPERRVMTTAQNVKKAEEEQAKAQKTRDEKQEALAKAKTDDKNVPAAEKAAAEAETAFLVAGTVIERAKAIAERAVKNLADAQQVVADREELLKQQEAAKETAVAAAKAAPLVVRSLAFSADSRRLAVGCDDGAIQFYDAASGSPAETQAQHTAAVRAITFAPGELLVTVAADRRALAWSASSEWRLQRTVGLGDDQHTGVGALADRVLGLDFSSDGRWLATAGGVPSRSGELKIWSVADGRLVREIAAAHSDTIFSVRFSPDGKRLATAAADRLVKVFDAQTGECLRSFAGHTAHVLGVDWKGDGQTLVSCGADNVLKLWDVEKGLPLRTMKGTTYQIGTYKREVTAAVFIGDSEQILAASGDGTVRLHRTTSDNDILTFSGAKGYQYAAAATPDGQIVAVGGADGTLRIWSGQTPQPKRTFGP